MRLGVAAALVGGELVDGDVEVVDGRVAAVGVGAPGGSLIAASGFVDLQVNGYAGVDFSAPGDEGYEVAGAALLAGGVTAFQPTLVTAGLDSMRAALARVPTDAAARCADATASRQGDRAASESRAQAVRPRPRVIGAHLEGPFISPSRPGAHDPAAIRPPDLVTLDALLDPPAARGTVSQVTLAPELPGALELIDALLPRGIVVSCGHTDADAAAAHAAFDRGATAVTHLFNAMRRPAPRDPGIAFAALGREDVFVTLIVDGRHLAEDTVRAAWRAAGERLVLISDAVAAAGAPDGDYTLGGTVEVRSEGGTVRTADGALAGTTLSMLDAVRGAHALGVPLAGALRAATEAPARMARRPDLGRLEPGARADLVVLDDSLELRQVLLGGVPVA
ncbi:MAG TPA: amidohydrolase family protein [Solirubrobacterales bacterium]|jgi:N-acetylglucosamine-6-phosphate deacetylase|nr:amidohydrolase family protein [Solirubrobacterales bacterium]